MPNTDFPRRELGAGQEPNAEFDVEKAIRLYYKFMTDIAQVFADYCISKAEMP